MKALELILPLPCLPEQASDWFASHGLHVCDGLLRKAGSPFTIALRTAAPIEALAAMTSFQMPPKSAVILQRHLDTPKQVDEARIILDACFEGGLEACWLEYCGMLVERKDWESGLKESLDGLLHFVVSKGDLLAVGMQLVDQPDLRLTLGKHDPIEARATLLAMADSIAFDECSPATGEIIELDEGVTLVYLGKGPALFAKDVPGHNSHGTIRFAFPAG